MFFLGLVLLALLIAGAVYCAKGEMYIRMSMCVLAAAIALLQVFSFLPETVWMSILWDLMKVGALWVVIGTIVYKKVSSSIVRWSVVVVGVFISFLLIVGRTRENIQEIPRKSKAALLKTWKEKLNNWGEIIYYLQDSPIVGSAPTSCPLILDAGKLICLCWGVSNQAQARQKCSRRPGFPRRGSSVQVVVRIKTRAAVGTDARRFWNELKKASQDLAETGFKVEMTGIYPHVSAQLLKENIQQGKKKSINFSLRSGDWGWKARNSGWYRSDLGGHLYGFAQKVFCETAPRTDLQKVPARVRHLPSIQNLSHLWGEIYSPPHWRHANPPSLFLPKPKVKYKRFPCRCCKKWKRYRRKGRIRRKCVRRSKKKKCWCSRKIPVPLRQFTMLCKMDQIVVKKDKKRD